METLQKIALVGCLGIAGALGFYVNDYLSNKRECVYQRNVQTTNANGNEGISNNRNATMNQMTESYVISGRCNFDFSKLDKTESVKKLK